MFSYVTNAYARVCVCVLCFSFLCGCVMSAKQFYVRNGSSGLLHGPFKFKDGEIVKVGRHTFLITEPEDGELQTEEKLQSIKLDVSFHKEPLPKVVEALAMKELEVVGISNMIPISLEMDARWRDPVKVRIYTQDGRVEWKDEMPEFPTITLVRQNCSLWQILCLVQESVSNPSLYLKISRNNVVFLLGFVPRER
jgi:hypothetical protein